MASRECPNCHSKKNWRDGLNSNHAQRFLCKECGYRFSEKSYKLTQTKEDRQLCVILKDAKKLDTATETKTAAGDRKINDATKKGLLLQYDLWLKKEGYGDKCRYHDCIRMLINAGCDIFNPENVKEVIGTKKWKNGTKMQMTYAYDALTKMLKISWKMPHYKQEKANPYIPEEKLLDMLILAARSKKMAAYLQTLKEAMPDPTEALRIEWTDIKGNVITINHPVKDHLPRAVPVSTELVALLNTLPRNSKTVFNVTYSNIARGFRVLRKVVAQRHNNPDILKIELRTFRHWAATMMFFRTKNILLVQRLLGHSKIENTMKYTKLIEFKDTEFEITTAQTVEELKAAALAGFEVHSQLNGIIVLRRSKRFSNFNFEKCHT